MAIIVFNIGWMTNYNGLENDNIMNGGAFIGERGFGGEIFNYSPFEGYMYGYVQPSGRGDYNSRIIRIERLGAPSGDSSIDGVLVAWSARKPEGGTYLVGWYKNATIFRRFQDPPEGARRVHEGEPLGYYVKVSADDCILLPPNERILKVPRANDPENQGRGGIGQANVWFAGNLIFRQQLNQFIEDFNN